MTTTTREETRASGRARGWDGARTLAVLVVLCVLLAGAAGYAWTRADRAVADGGDAEISSTAAREAGLRVAAPLTERVLSYDWRTLPADIAATKAVLAPGFRREYLATIDGLRAEAEENQVRVTAEAVASSVVSASESRVVALVFVDQVTTATGARDERVDASRVMVTLTRAGGDWRIAKLELF